MKDGQAKARLGDQFEELVAVVARLRGPEGCPWDRAQDHRSLRQHLLEEAYEVLETIDSGDLQALRGELGDVLLQVLLHAQLASEEREFDIGDVIRALRDKLVTRHPHVFRDKQIETPEAVVTEWEGIKRRERNQSVKEQAVTGIPRQLPALARAQTALRKAARAGVSGSAEEAARALAESQTRLAEAAPAAAEEALGDLLFAAVDLARLHGVEAEQALRERVDRFLREVQVPADEEGAE